MQTSEPVFETLKLAGAAYLAYLGAQSLRRALAQGERGHVSPETNPLSPGRAFRQGLLSNLGNPKIAVFFASMLPQFVPQGSGSFAILLALGLVFCTMGLAWLTVYAVAVARIGRLLAGSARRALDAVTGVVLVALGLRLATEKP